MNVVRIGQVFIAAAMAAFGLQCLAYGDFVTRALPPVPQTFPGRPFAAALAGLFLLIGGVAIMLRLQGRIFALTLGSVILAWFAIFLLPSLLSKSADAMLVVNSGKALVLAGACLVAAGSLPSAKAGKLSRIEPLSTLIPLGRFFLAGFLIMAGIMHFLFPAFVAMLIPRWIPAAFFWAYFTGVALIAGGVGIIVPFTTRMAAAASGIMIFLWVVLLHIPRALADLHDANETTAMFEALAMCGTSLLIACKNK